MANGTGTGVSPENWQAMKLSGQVGVSKGPYKYQAETGALSHQQGEVWKAVSKELVSLSLCFRWTLGGRMGEKQQPLGHYFYRPAKGSWGTKLAWWYLSMWTKVIFRDLLEAEKSNSETNGLWKIKKIEDSKLPLSVLISSGGEVKGYKCCYLRQECSGSALINEVQIRRS